MNRKELEAAHVLSGRVKVVVGEEDVIYLYPKVFSTHAMGWHGQCKVQLGDTPCQANVVITILASRPGEARGGEGTPEAGEQKSKKPRKPVEHLPRDLPLPNGSGVATNGREGL